MFIKIDRGGSRKKLGLALAAAGSSLAFVLLTILRQAGAPAQPPMPKAFFIDEETGEVSTRPSDDLAPLPGKAGRLTVVRANYFCTANNGQRWIGYLEKFDESAVERVRAELAASRSRGGGGGGMLGGPSPLYKQSLLVRLPARGSPWVKAESPEGVALVNGVHAPGDPSAKVYRVEADDP